jgi:hypothetical protein
VRPHGKTHDDRTRQLRAQTCRRQPPAVPPYSTPLRFTRANTTTPAGLCIRRDTSRAKTASQTRRPRRPLAETRHGSPKQSRTARIGGTEGRGGAEGHAEDGSTRRECPGPGFAVFSPCGNSGRRRPAAVSVVPTGPEAPQERPPLGISLANVQNGRNERVSSEGGASSASSCGSSSSSSSSSRSVISRAGGAAKRRTVTGRGPSVAPGALTSAMSGSLDALGVDVACR